MHQSYIVVCALYKLCINEKYDYTGLYVHIYEGYQLFGCIIEPIERMHTILMVHFPRLLHNM